MSTLSGDYHEIGRFMAVNYDFATRDPTRRLRSVTIARRAATTPEFNELLAELQSAIGKAIGKAIGPLQQRSEIEYQATGPGCHLMLTANSRTLFIYEVFQLPE